MINKKTCIFLLPVLLFHIHLFAQQDTGKSSLDIKVPPPDSAKSKHEAYFAVNAGLGLPMGVFKSANSSVDQGYAMPGISISIYRFLPINYSPNSAFGLILQLGYNLNKVDNNAYFNTLSNLGRKNLTASTNSYWNLWSFMAGFAITQQIHRISVNLKLIAGITYGITPEISYSGINSYTGDSVNYDTKPALTQGFAYSAGIAINYRIINNWSIGVNTELLGSSVNATAICKYTNYTHPDLYPQYSFSEYSKIGVANIGIQAAYSVPFYNKKNPDSLKLKPKVFITFNVGTSDPIWGFDLSDHDQEHMGDFALPGATYNLQAGFPFCHQKWELEAMLAYVWNGIDIYKFIGHNFSTDVIVNNAYYYAPIEPSTINPLNPKYTFYDGIFGIARTIKGQYLSLDFRFMFGFTSAHFSPISINDSIYIPSGKMQGTLNIGSANFFSSAFDFGIGLKVFITNHICAMIHTDTFISGSAMLFNIPYTNTGSNGVVYTNSVASFSKWPVMQSNLSFGLGYTFPYYRK